MAQVNGSTFNDISYNLSSKTHIVITGGFAYMTYEIETNPSNIIVHYKIYSIRYGNFYETGSTITSEPTVSITDTASISTSTSSRSGSYNYNMDFRTSHALATNPLVLENTLQFNRSSSSYTSTINFSITQRYELQTQATKTASSNGSLVITIPALPKSTISYHANGGNGNVAPTTHTYGQNDANFNNASEFYKYGTYNITVSQNPLKTVTAQTRGIVSKWCKNSSGSGDLYTPGGAVPTTWNDTCTLYAIWDIKEQGDGDSQNKYVYPALYDVTLIRTKTSDIADVQTDDLGEYLYIEFKWIGFSNNYGSTFNTPECEISINGSNPIEKDLSDPIYTNNTFKWKPSGTFSIDSTYNINIKLYNENDPTMQTNYSGSIGTAIYPIDIFGEKVINGNETHSNVYMGIMTAYVEGQPLTVTDTFAVNLYLNIETNSSTGTDFVIKDKLDTLNWRTACSTIPTPQS